MMDEMHTLAVPLASDTPSSAPGRPDEPEALRRQNASSASVQGQIGNKPESLQVGEIPAPPPQRACPAELPARGPACSARPGTAPRPSGPSRGGEGPLCPRLSAAMALEPGSAFFLNRSVNRSVR